MVSKGNVVEIEVVVVNIKGAPAPVRTLHADDPVYGFADFFLIILFIQCPGPEKGHKDHGRVVNIRVKGVFKLEGPACRPHVRHPVGPVPGNLDQVLEKPVCGRCGGFVVGRKTGLENSRKTYAGIPYGGDTGLAERFIAVGDQEIIYRLDTTDNIGVIIGIT